MKQRLVKDLFLPELHLLETGAQVPSSIQTTLFVAHVH